MFNKEIFERFNGGAGASQVLYDIVNEGNGKKGGWTVETLYNYASTNFVSDSGKDKYEIDYIGSGTYGLMTQHQCSTVLLQSNGYTPTRSENYGAAFYDNIRGNSSFVTAVEMVFDLMGGQGKEDWLLDADDVPESASKIGDIWADVIRASFKADKILFYIGHVGTINLVRDMTTEFGLLPIPKLFDTQTEYGNTIQYGNGICYCIPNFGQAFADEATYMLEAMAYFSSPDYFEAMGVEDASLKYAYRETVLKRKATRDDESMAMLDLIFDNRVYDLAMALNLGDIDGALRNVCCSESAPNFTSAMGQMPQLTNLLDEQLKTLYLQMSQHD